MQEFLTVKSRCLEFEKSIYLVRYIVVLAREKLLYPLHRISLLLLSSHHLHLSYMLARDTVLKTMARSEEAWRASLRVVISVPFPDPIFCDPP